MVVPPRRRLQRDRLWRVGPCPPARRAVQSAAPSPNSGPYETTCENPVALSSRATVPRAQPPMGTTAAGCFLGWGHSLESSGCLEGRHGSGPRRKWSQVEASGLRWRGAIAGGGERSQVEASGLRLRGAVAGGGERSQVEGRGLRWRGAVSGGGERTPVGRVPSKRHPG